MVKNIKEYRWKFGFQCHSANRHGKKTIMGEEKEQGRIYDTANEDRVDYAAMHLRPRF